MPQCLNGTPLVFVVLDSEILPIESSRPTNKEDPFVASGGIADDMSPASPNAGIYYTTILPGVLERKVMQDSKEQSSILAYQD